jgi:hypothetical protein
VRRVDPHKVVLAVLNILHAMTNARQYRCNELIILSIWNYIGVVLNKEQEQLILIIINYEAEFWKLKNSVPHRWCLHLIVVVGFECS